MAPTGGGTTVRSLGSTQGLQFRWVRRARDVHGVARAAADEVLRLGHEAVEQRGVFRVALSAGYRLIDLDVEYDDGADPVDFQLELSGLYLGLTLAF